MFKMKETQKENKNELFGRKKFKENTNRTNTSPLIANKNQAVENKSKLKINI